MTTTPPAPRLREAVEEVITNIDQYEAESIAAGVWTGTDPDVLAVTGIRLKLRAALRAEPVAAPPVERLIAFCEQLDPESPIGRQARLARAALHAPPALDAARMEKAIRETAMACSEFSTDGTHDDCLPDHGAAELIAAYAGAATPASGEPATPRYDLSEDVTMSVPPIWDDDALDDEGEKP